MSLIGVPIPASISRWVPSLVTRVTTFPTGIRPVVKALPMIIDAGVEALHPIQAMAAGMDAERLARDFGNDLIFMGGVDTQRLLPFGTTVAYVCHCPVP